jgi:uncharacterized protein YcbX
MSEARISGLYVYPVKSCRGIRVERAEVGRRGFVRDRRWMVVDPAGRFISQREEPLLCRLVTALGPAGIELHAEGHEQLVLPTEHEDGQELDVSVWQHEGAAVRHEAGSEWLSRVLQRPCSLVYMAERHERPVNPARARPGDIVSFADGYPFLVISEGSLDDLNSRLSEPLEMARFRPNIVVTGVPPYAEDAWSEVALGALTFRAVKRCDRCVVTTLDPRTGEGGKEPLHTLAKYRKSEGKVWFGMNLIHDAPGWLAVGDTVTNRAP